MGFRVENVRERCPISRGEYFQQKVDVKYWVNEDRIYSREVLYKK